MLEGNLNLKNKLDEENEKLGCRIKKVFHLRFDKYRDRGMPNF